MQNRGHRTSPAHTFERLATAGCPPQADLLSALGAAVGGQPASGGVDFALDDLSRRLFDAAGAPSDVAARRLGDLLSCDPRFAVDHDDPRGLMLQWVLTRRVGHPLLLAVVMAEAGRRAGMDTGVFSSPQAWYAGLGDTEGLWLVETIDDRDVEPPAQLRGHCAHEIAWAVLLGLEQRYLKRRDEDLAARCRRLRGRLPTQHTRSGTADPL